MPGHTSAHGSKSKSHGDQSKGPENSPFSSGFQGASKTSSRVNNTNRRETYRTTPRTIDAGTKRRNELALKVAKQKKDAQAFKDYSYTKPTGLGKFSPIAQVADITGLGKKAFEVNKSYYERNVIGKEKPGGGFYGASVEDYKGYISGRGSGDIDAMGRTINKDNNTGGRLVVQKNIGGSTILTETKTQAEKTAEAEQDSEYDTRKTKRRGRRMTILTSRSGTTGNLVLGKPSLLGA
tara:strand:+ start:188 stop:898 length:711 start_codon:yes stop_codon:yes gene_type:complete